MRGSTPVNPPSKTQLDLLVSLESGKVVTQGTISKRLGVLIGMINALVKRTVHKGYVKVTSAPYKRYAYCLTPKGFSEKSRLVAEYLEISLSFFWRAREEYAQVFEWAPRTGIQRLALVGSGEFACLAAREAEIDLVAVVDREINRDRVFGILVVRDPVELDGVDAVVTTDVAAPQSVSDRLVERFEDQRVLAPALLRITRARLDEPGSEGKSADRRSRGRKAVA